MFGVSEAVGGAVVLVAAPLAVMLQAGPANAVMLVLALLPGTMLLSLLGTLAALTLGARRSAVLMPLITLPLVIPTLIFGAAVASSPHPLAPLLSLAAMLAAALPLSPLAAGRLEMITTRAAQS